MHSLQHFQYTAVQSQKAVSAYFTSEQILTFGFAGQYSTLGKTNALRITQLFVVLSKTTFGKVFVPNVPTGNPETYEAF